MGLDSVARAVGWKKPTESKRYRMSVLVDCSDLSLKNWLPCTRCLVDVILSIQPFVSPFYDRLPGLISVIDPPPVISAAWPMVRPLLGQPTRDVVRFEPAAQAE